MSLKNCNLAFPEPGNVRNIKFLHRSVQQKQDEFRIETTPSRNECVGVRHVKIHAKGQHVRCDEQYTAGRDLSLCDRALRLHCVSVRRQMYNDADYTCCCVACSYLTRGGQ